MVAVQSELGDFEYKPELCITYFSTMVPTMFALPGVEFKQYFFQVQDLVVKKEK